LISFVSQNNKRAIPSTNLSTITIEKKNLFEQQKKEKSNGTSLLPYLQLINIAKTDVFCYYLLMKLCIMSTATVS
jgi:hypothetical protein